MITKATLWVVTLNARQKTGISLLNNVTPWNALGSSQEVRHEEESYGFYILNEIILSLFTGMEKVVSNIPLSLINISRVDILKAGMESDFGVTYPYVTENIF